MSGPVVKICGIRTAETARLAWQAGADFLGLVFAPSPRQVDEKGARTIVRRVPGRYIGVFRDITRLESLAEIADRVGLFGVQCHGRCPEGWTGWAKEQGMMAIATDITVVGADVWLLDGPRSGSGIAWEWALPHQGGPYWISGGLRPENVRRVVDHLKPSGVDVSTGVERDYEKDPELIAQFIKEAKACPQ